MGDLGAIHEDVKFNWTKASELSTEMRSTATVLEWQNGERTTLRGTARTAWRGRYGDEFDDRVTTCTGDAGRFVTSLRAAATGLDELARLAREEQNRREAARAWLQQQEEDKGTGLGIPVVDDIVEEGRDLLMGEDDIPPPPPPVQPPTIPIGDPGVVTRSQAPSRPTPTYGTGGVSSAKPDDLDQWVGDVQTLDDAITTKKGSLTTLHTEFRSTLGWGQFDATSLFGAIGTWLSWNETDRRWVTEIAKAFREAGAGTIADSVISARLTAAGLNTTRTSVTYDEPSLWGAAPTSGFANDPVNTASGNFVEPELDVPAGGPSRFLEVTRTYNSRSDRVGPFGRGWASWAMCRLTVEPHAALWVGVDGQEVTVPRTGDGGFARVAALAGRVVADPDRDGVRFLAVGGMEIRFDAAGLPTSVEHGPGTRVELDHNEGRLVGMRHNGGRITRFVWDRGRIVTVHGWDGRVVQYHYDAELRLVWVEGGPRGARSYTLDAAGRVVAVTDADGVVEVTNRYDGDGRVLGQASPHGRRTRFRYLDGRITLVDDEDDGPANTYAHDDHGRLIGAVDGHGYELTKDYDAWGNPVLVTERDGTTIVQDWDDRGRLVRHAGPDGYERSVTYDELDRVVVIEASDGTSVHYRYDGAERLPAEIVGPEGAVTRMTVVDGLLRHAIDADGVEVSYDYDAHGELVAITDGLGHTTRYERDAASRLVAVVTPLGRRSELAYDDAGRPVAFRDPAGGRTELQWSAAGRLVAVVDPGGARRMLEHGTNGEAERMIDALGHVTTRRFDVFGNVVGLVSADGAKWELGYDQLCRPVSVADPAGATWLREYDAMGREVAEIDPVGVRHGLRYDSAGRLAGIDDGLTSVDFERDAAGRVVRRRRPDGSEVRIGYDRCGRVTSIVDPLGGETRYGYTPAGRIASLTSPAGATTLVEYDECGRRAAVVDPLGNRRVYGYDEDGRLAGVSSPAGDITLYRYDPAGRLCAVVTQSGGETRYEHDAAGRIVAITDPTGGVRRFTWDGAGRLLAATDPNGGVVHCEHDASGQLRALVDPLGGRVTYDYDAAGRVVARRDQIGRTTRWDYDPAGRLREVVLATGERRRWWYDESGRVRGIGTGSDAADVAEPVVTVERDDLGRPVVVAEPDLRHELEWDSLGRLIGRRRNGRGLSWRYDADGRRTAVATPDGAETTFEIDSAGRVVSAAHPAAGSVALRHDAAGRLIERAAAGGTERWRYVDGQLVEHQGTCLERDAAGRVTAAVVDGKRTAYAYDAAGQLVRVTAPDGTWIFRYDIAGRLAEETRPDGQVVTYTYDAAHQLVGRQSSDGLTSYEYDAAGRRCAETTQEGTTRRYEWDWRGRLTRIGDVEVQVDAVGDLARIGDQELFWDPVGTVAPRLRWMGDATVLGDDRPWGTVRPSGGERTTRPSGGERTTGPDAAAQWFGADWQGSVGAADRDPWGAAAPTDGADLGYRGELGVAGLLWLRHRVYDPVGRAFLTTDPLPGVAGTAFAAYRYHYAGNDPIGAVDPLGLRPMTDADLEAYRQAAMAEAGWLETGLRYIGGGAMVAIGFLGAINPLSPLARILPEPLRPLVALGNPLHLLTGGGQTLAALIAGERDPGQLARHFVNGPGTTFGQGLAIMGGADLSYNDQHGIWTAENSASWTSGRGGTTYGSIFVTPTNEQAIEDAFNQGLRPHGWNGLLEHEAAHSDQWARWGGGIAFPILYGIEEWTSGGEGCNKYEQEADLDKGNYPHC